MAAKKTTKEMYIVGNWKMNPAAAEEARELAEALRSGLGKADVRVVVCPPYPFIPAVAAARAAAFELGGQDCSVHSEGAHTGEVSSAMLADLGCSYVIVGHSERRALGETDEIVNRKVKAALKAGLRPIIAIGEKSRDSFDTSGRFSAELDPIIKEQLAAALVGVSAQKARSVIIAYEPVWAIGTGHAASADDVFSVRIFLQKALRELYDASTEATIPILYGGSTDANSDALLAESGVDGFLVGGASLKAEEFIAMVADASRIGAQRTSS